MTLRGRQSVDGVVLSWWRGLRWSGDPLPDVAWHLTAVLPMSSIWALRRRELVRCWASRRQPEGPCAVIVAHSHVCGIRARVIESGNVGPECWFGRRLRMPTRSPNAATPVMSSYCRRDEPLTVFRTNHASICAAVSNTSTVTNSLINFVYISPSRNHAGRARIATPTGPRSRSPPATFTRSASCWRSASVDASVRARRS